MPDAGRRFDRLLAVPFRQVAERGFEAHDDGAPLTVVDVDLEVEVPLADLLAALPDGRRRVPRPRRLRDLRRGVRRRSCGGSSTTRSATARAPTSSSAGTTAPSSTTGARSQALAVLRRLLERERGAYWTYCFFTGERYLVGASPERHVSVHGGDVRMNPISGTFRLRGLAEEERKARLLEFLADEKEIYELFMVVDEELKMMCDICNEGGQVLGPVPQADDAPGAHRVPPRRPHHPRRPRRCCATRCTPRR